ncbi:MAG: helix-turn-helix transcriptional regulator [Acidobacteriaceae bacterium]
MAKSKVSFPIDWQAVGRRIRELRGYDMNQAEMAMEVGIGQSHLSAIERGKKEPSASVLHRIAMRYGKTIEWLLTGSDPQVR